MFHVRIRIPSNFISVHIGFNCPNCQHEIGRDVVGEKVCHRTNCPFCSQDVMVHLDRHPGKPRKRREKLR